ncbi:hypothetical protein [Bordetella genomosp. 12]|uniref:Copper-binding protein n=1 Tax=Bordetella genomosp. 12 TaxID=463035 RepID=A0A261VIN4_9BORD|nr:hypothetical protein [Bordetella genomosp. 12]OZI74004.1 hypothetical protein CAL22_05750 [Bordetella genomosp. 12]
MKVQKLLALTTRAQAIAALAAALAITTPLLPVPAQARVVDATLVRAAGKVTAIDPSTRMLTVTDPNGESVMLQAGPQVRNFDRIKVGDVVQLSYYESLNISVRPKGTGAPEVRTESATTRPTLGKRPQGGAGVQTTVTAEIWHIGRNNNTVILQGPDGSRQTVVVHDPQAIKTLAHLKEGDLVDFTFTRALAGAVVAPAKKH